MRVPYRVKKFSALMQSTSASLDTSATESWYGIRESIYQVTLDSCDKNTETNKDWFQENIDVLLIELKQQPHVEYLLGKSSKSLNRLREARKVFQKLEGNALTSYCSNLARVFRMF